MRVGKIILIIIILAFALGVGYRVYRLVADKKDSSERVEEMAVIVRAIPVEKGDIRRDISLTGDVEAIISVQVFPKTPGRLIELKEEHLERVRKLFEEGAIPTSPVEKAVAVDEGDSVLEEQIIAVIDHEDFDTQVVQARAALTTARAQLSQAGVSLAQTEKDLKKTRNLYEQGATSKQSLDKLETEYENLVQQKNVAQSRVDQYQAALSQAQILLSECFIRAPISGIISHKYLEEGDMAMVTRPIFAIVDIDEVEITADLPERYLSQVHDGTEAFIKVDAFPNREFQGTVTRISPTLDVTNRTAKLEITVPNPDHALRPGMFARVALTVAKEEQVVVIQEAAVLRRGVTPYVFVVEEDIARRRDVVLGLEEGPRVEVSAGLTPGQLLVVAGQQKIADGDLVQIEG